MRTYAIRLHPGQDLKKRVIKFCNENKIQAGVILTCVGSLSKATLRLADENIKKEFVEKFEIVSLVGTLSPDGVHLHLSISDKDGNTFGGHLKEGCIIYTTAEIIIGEIGDLRFERKVDETTKFKELVISKR
ncbi:DNA-binding protein [archaeon]|jgi:uncharacterized protein|nr:DNA-binding protein [archaeon]MBT6762884.1 DNA-binding protein [archaeon]MBT7706908.1 DNA-binding protein [archaeon]